MSASALSFTLIAAHHFALARITTAIAISVASTICNALTAAFSFTIATTIIHTLVAPLQSTPATAV